MKFLSLLSICITEFYGPFFSAQLYIFTGSYVCVLSVGWNVELCKSLHSCSLEQGWGGSQLHLIATAVHPLIS